MHAEAYEWISQFHTAKPISVIEFGARDLNGSIRNLFPNADPYKTLDILPGEGVSIVADAGTWEPDREYHMVICAETFEHAVNWASICRVAYKSLKSGGKFIVTTAGPGRHIHSGIDGHMRLFPFEHYANVPGYELQRVLTETGFRDIVVDTQPDPPDTRAVATKVE